MDKVGAVYEVQCKKHNTKYVGETERPLKKRAYEHRIIEHNESVVSHSLKRIDEEETVVE